VAYGAEAAARSSFLLLAGSGGRANQLTLAELLDDPDLALTADLVVLSACETALGTVRVAEGAMGFQRALLARGARSALVSLWSVSDVTTELLMKAFYRHWIDDADRPSKALALARAQADLRANPAYAHPVFWAGFQLVGAR
jgi:CHAT domain-containing protein